MNAATKSVSMLCLVWCIVMSGADSTANAAEVFVIANKEIPAESLDPDAIKKIFLGDVVNWDNNEVIMVVVTKEKEIHEAFLKKYIKRTESQFANVWRRNLFTGKGAMSKKVESGAEMVEYVAKTKGAIGYAASDTPLPADVKIVGQ